MIYKTRGIILRRKNFGEADRLLTIFTSDRGKIRVLAKGTRKTLSKLAGNLELFCLTKLNIAEGRNLDIVTGAVIDKCFLGIRDNLENSNTVHYLAETVDQMTDENEKHPEIFNLLDQALEHINTYPEPLLLSYFELHLLREVGFEPELYECLDCKEKLKPENNIFNFEKGGLVCSSCAQTINDKISADAIKIIRLLANHEINIIKKIKADKKVINEVKKVLANYIRHIHQKDFKSRRFIK